MVLALGWMGMRHSKSNRGWKVRAKERSQRYHPSDIHHVRPCSVSLRTRCGWILIDG